MAQKLFRRTPIPLLLFLALTIVMGLAACGATSPSSGGLYGSSGSTATSGNTSGSTAQTSCADSTALICTRSVSVNGTNKDALVSRDGKTLYYFTSDSATTVACTSAGGCITTWPPLMSTSASVSPISGLTGVLTTVDRSGQPQMEYNGHPLYTYAADSAPGDTKGDGLFGKWFVATVDLAPASGSDGNGYSGY
jgi:predicted lipoprotein with Yx(FWY)xxD motif